MAASMMTEVGSAQARAGINSIALSGGAHVRLCCVRQQATWPLPALRNSATDAARRLYARDAVVEQQLLSHCSPGAGFSASERPAMPLVSREARVLLEGMRGRS